MYFKTNENRMFWFNILTYLVIDTLLGMLGAWYFNGGMWFVIITVLLFQLVLPIIYLLRSILYWLLFYNVTKMKISEAFFHELINDKFPAPRDIENSVAEYFDYVSTHNIINKKALLLSMFYLGYLKCLNDSWSFISASAMNSGLEDAIIRYKHYLITKNDSNDGNDSKKVE